VSPTLWLTDPGLVHEDFKMKYLTVKRSAEFVKVAVLALNGLTLTASAQERAQWWMDEPIRFLQTNLRERDSAVDPKRLVEQVAEYGANVFLCNMGGSRRNTRPMWSFTIAASSCRRGETCLVRADPAGDG
jgi:hypothetical protein